MILFLQLLLHLQFIFGLARPPPKGASDKTELSAFVDAPNCFPALGFKMPASVPSSLTNWWCNPAKEYAFLGFSYEVTACTKARFIPRESPSPNMNYIQARAQLNLRKSSLTSETNSRVVMFGYMGSAIVKAFSEWHVSTLRYFPNFRLSNDIVDAAWASSLGVHALIWVRRITLP